MIGESILSWNCRGAGSKEFACEIKELMKVYKPTVIILLEPRISGGAADSACKKLVNTVGSGLKRVASQGVFGSCGTRRRMICN